MRGYKGKLCREMSGYEGKFRRQVSGYDRRGEEGILGGNCNVVWGVMIVASCRT